MNDKRDKNHLTEAEYLASYNSDAWKKPSLTADICIFSTINSEDHILLIRRGNHPYLGVWALPGGFSQENERIEDTAARELFEETGVRMDASDLTLVGVYSKPGRDPRGWTVSVAFLAVVDSEKLKPIASDDADDVGWFSIKELNHKNLAFDHDEILADAIHVMKTLGKKEKSLPIYPS